MKKHLFATTTALLLVASAATTQAQTRTPRIASRQNRQEARIYRGEANGSLTNREANRLQGREAGLQAEKQAMKADGVVTPQERQDLRRTENRNSRAIYRQKHDAQVR